MIYNRLIVAAIGFIRLEPYDGKLSRTVLRGGKDSNALLLPDYASVEMLYQPEHAGKPLAVGGDPEARHGIVLTANYTAKQKGVKTGQALWQAKSACPDLVVVPPRMDLYLQFSSMLREIYGEYLRLGRQDGCISSMKIRKDILKEWKLTEEEVWKNAVENTSLMTPPRIYRWEELLVTPLYSGDDFMNDEKLYFLDRENFAGLCLSTALRTNGAVAVFLPGVAQRLADLLNDSFYIVFTSIHEAMIHAAKNVYPEDLIKVMHDSIKEATSEQDFLTDKLYFYNRNEEKIAQYNPKTAIIDVHFPINPEE